MLALVFAQTVGMEFLLRDKKRKTLPNLSERSSNGFRQNKREPAAETDGIL